MSLKINRKAFTYQRVSYIMILLIKLKRFNFLILSTCKVIIIRFTSILKRLKLGGTNMPISLARIDQRLIHGITVNQWNRVLHPKRFMVVDDEASQNEMIKASMRMSKPSGTGMSIISRETAITNFKNGKYDTHSVFVIAKEPSTILDLIRGGVEIPEVNVGALFKEGDRISYTQRVALNDAEVADLKEIVATGLPVSFQYTPDDDEKVSLENVLKKGKN